MATVSDKEFADTLVGLLGLIEALTVVSTLFDTGVNGDLFLGATIKGGMMAAFLLGMMITFLDALSLITDGLTAAVAILTAFKADVRVDFRTGTSGAVATGLLTVF